MTQGPSRQQSQRPAGEGLIASPPREALRPCLPRLPRAANRCAGLLTAAAILLSCGSARAQTATNAAAGIASGASSNAWSFSASVSTYLVPNSRDYVNPTLTADQNWLHLEARYNYEALYTGSLWAGYNLSFGRTLVLDVTPMLGGVFGDLTGIAPGYEASLTWRSLSLSSQGEFVCDTGNSANSYFYTWTELSCSPVEWCRAGLVIQRTKLYHTDFDIQRGFLVGCTYKKLDFTAYVFNLGWTDPTLVFTVGVQF